MATITQTGGCSCGKVKFEIKDAKAIANCLCHCKSCSRARSASPVHLILVPQNTVTVTEGEEFLVEKKRDDSQLTQVQCSECGCSVWQYPQSKPVKAMFPTTFHIEQGEKACMLVSMDYLKKHLACGFPILRCYRCIFQHGST